VSVTLIAVSVCCSERNAPACFVLPRQRLKQKVSGTRNFVRNLAALVLVPRALEQRFAVVSNPCEQLALELKLCLLGVVHGVLGLADQTLQLLMVGRDLPGLVATPPRGERRLTVLLKQMDFVAQYGKLACCTRACVTESLHMCEAVINLR
jgi:hypothetical protein